jgi:sedoheptulokinase
MLTIGLDIGTTTISAVAADPEKGVQDTITVNNDTFIHDGPSWERIQDPEEIWEKAFKCVQHLVQMHPDCACIGVTGQQHGILYLNQNGRSLSPLYTWQDCRSAQPAYGNKSYANLLSEHSGYSIPVGYGMATHDYNLKNNLVPIAATVFCTIQDYVAMRLAGRTIPQIEASNAASFGLFNLHTMTFDTRAAKRAKMDTTCFPIVTASSVLGIGPLGLPVCTAIGDNQASFIGATAGAEKGMLVNVGTGSQISIWIPAPLACADLEVRPYPLGGFLMVGASICGGRAYAILERFFRQTVEMVTGNSYACYDAMAELAAQGCPEKPPTFITTFQGTRNDPEKSGSIIGLTERNFTPSDFIYGLLNGTVQELYDLYQRCLSLGITEPKQLYGAGNGLRKNKLLQDILQRRFGLPLEICPHEEEAAYGAALYAAYTLKAAH